MSAADVQQIVGTPIICHAFNKDRTELALSPNSNEVYIFKKTGTTWTQTATLSEHDKLVTGIDWDPIHNRIVTCSQDRNAYVWTWTKETDRNEKGEMETIEGWKPTLVILRINRAATQVKWSPKGDKFAVASGAKCISICYFEKDNDWWVSKHIKKPINSTVLSIDWHPNNVLIACGSSDFKARVFSGYIKGVDDKPEGSSWGSKLPFGDMFGEFTSGGWVHDVAFSPDGECIAFVGHDASIGVAAGPEAKSPVKVILKTSSLPFTHLLWVTGKSIIAAGHDNNPTLFSFDGSNIKQVEKLDTGKGGDKGGANKDSAMNKFRQMDTRAQEADNDTVLKTLHQNAISGLLAHTGGRGAVTKFSTVGIDGKMIIWDLKSLEQSIAGLKII
jgi:actin related protein 2/3 complex subunit 1A/1B